MSAARAERKRKDSPLRSSLGSEGGFPSVLWSLHFKKGGGERCSIRFLIGQHDESASLQETEGEPFDVNWRSIGRGGGEDTEKWCCKSFQR